MVVFVMLFIAWMLDNSYWAYGALALTLLSALVKATAQVKVAKKTQNEAIAGVNDFIKSIQAKLN